MNTASQDETLLLECLASPWSSAFQLAARAGIAPAIAEAACERLRLAGYMQRIQQHLSFLPSALYAPATSALALIAERWRVSSGVVARKARLSDARFRWLRESLEIAQEVNGLCSTLAQAKPEWQVSWEAGIVRTYRGVPLVLHGRLGTQVPLPSGDYKRGVFYLLMDRGQQKTLGWWRMIRYLSIVSRRDGNQNDKRNATTFPPLLIVTTHAFRAASLLRLTHKFNARLSLAVSWDRETIFAKGAHAAEWFALLRDEQRRVRLVPAHPFLPDGMCAGAPKHWPLRITRPRSTKLTAQPLPVLDAETNWCKVASVVEALDETHMRALVFLCRHPLCLESTLQTFLQISSQQAGAILQKLCEVGLATPEHVALPIDRKRISVEISPADNDFAQKMRAFARCDAASTEFRIADAFRHGAQVTSAKLDGNGSRTSLVQKMLPLTGFWQATPAAVRLRACRDGRNPYTYCNAYAALCRERHNRPYHALAVYDFFERMQRDCERYAAATRKMAGVNADYYELIVFEDELQARTSFEHGGSRRYWCPDGYGVVRCGEHCTPFWLEIDGTLHTRARSEVDVWSQKFDTLCAYFCSGDWTRTHPAFPALLIVTAQADLKARLRDILEKTGNGHGISAPTVFLASRDAWLQRGPLAPIWTNLSNTVQPYQMDYAFTGAQQPGVLTAPASKARATDNLRNRYIKEFVQASKGGREA